jgi:signal peptidase I
MTELKLNPEPEKPATFAESAERPSSRWKGPIFSVLLSLLFPGLGQWRNREPWKGVIIAILSPSLVMIAGYSRILLSFKGMVGFIGLTIVIAMLVGIDAFRNARAARQSRKSFRQTKLVFAASGVIILTLAFVPSTEFWLRKFNYLRAFKVPSASMCPAICEGDRFVANMDSYLHVAPRRGDIIMMSQSLSAQLYIKRVIGVEGDVVSGPDGKIQVNGKPLTNGNFPEPCGKVTRESSPDQESVRFEPVKVPAASFFVIGDNLTNSYDSRFGGFGLVTAQQVKGRPVFIYWSRTKGRMGCHIR